MNDIENIIFEIAEALRVPVLVLTIIALAAVLLELGAFIVELVRRRRRDFNRLETASHEARAALHRGDEIGAKSALRPVAWSTQMARTLAFIVDQWGKGQTGDRMAKGLADFDFRSLRRLERTRLLVRAGPALGLMGTLIPLSPALAGLANGNVEELSDNLRVAFSVTVLGLLVGALAFAISLVRDRIYGQDLSDLEFVMATLSPDAETGGAAAAMPSVARPAADASAPPVAASGAGASSDAQPPPPPNPSAAVTDKPPPPTGAKPLGAMLAPPAAGSSEAPTTPDVPAPAPVAPPEAAAAAPPAPAPEVPAAPDAPPAAPAPGNDHVVAPDRDATRAQAQPPVPPESPAPPAVPGEEPTSQLPAPPIPERPSPSPERTTEDTW